MIILYANYYLIMKYLLLFIAIQTVLADIIGNPINIINTSEYHAVPFGTYLQFSLNSGQIFYESHSSSELSISLSLQNLTQPAIYNILYFPSFDPNSLPLSHCYKKAVMEGLLNCSCNFTQSTVTEDGNCTQCLKNALENNDNYFACYNCIGSISLMISNDSLIEQSFIENGTVLLILDNTNLLHDNNVEATIGMFMKYSIQMSIDEGYNAFVYLIAVIFGVILIVLIIIAIYVTRKSTIYQRQIHNFKKNNT